MNIQECIECLKDLKKYSLKREKDTTAAVLQFAITALDLKWQKPEAISKKGWYRVSDNSGDRWVVYCDPNKSDYDKLFGRDQGDEIMICGPIEWPERKSDESTGRG